MHQLTGRFGTHGLGRRRQGADHIRSLAGDVLPKGGRKPPYQGERRADEPLRGQLRERPVVRLSGVDSVEQKLLLKLALQRTQTGVVEANRVAWISIWSTRQNRVSTTLLRPTISIAREENAFALRAGTQTALWVAGHLFHRRQDNYTHGRSPERINYWRTSWTRRRLARVPRRY